MSAERPTLGEDFNVSPFVFGRWPGWLVVLPKKTKVGTLWISHAWRAGIDDAIAAGHIIVARKNAQETAA